MRIQRLSYPLLGALALCAFLVGLAGEAEAKEFKFTAQELAKGKKPIEPGGIEIWLPNSVVIDQKEDLNEPIWFVLENPTGIDHEFAVGGLYMHVTKEEAADVTMDHIIGQARVEKRMIAPIRVTVKAAETKKIQVAPDGLAGKRNLGASYRFFCPMHMDVRVSGFIFVD